MKKDIKQEVVNFLMGDGFTVSDEEHRQFNLPDLRNYLIKKGFSEEEVNLNLTDMVESFKFEFAYPGENHILKCDYSGFVD